ncbi:Na+/H+ antiporter family protein [Halalkalibacterium halodurans]|uniref:BH3359 protein n=1 Tax=Halalkalibacterium halodurans (strain ATCC BAA-125 / DSM 18197 / FERM 7344 / JCM 9153 / C-125) TaxID=272558 RepID=Q9K7K2_HALH5|nr:Na+/H+ antiporter family protein [Halalkalibacterium halodurans]MED4172745.1 Na+/H+ antiporter family protein [Halalkalibacterium halodurans]BAB07078.1 BH3359 [Halalkalibacterium halodurans C-125]
MNAVLLAVIVMLVLSLLRVHVVLALSIGAIVGGVVGGLGFLETIEVFSEGLGGNATVALSYALLGAFAVAISKTGLPDVMVNVVLRLVGKEGENRRKTLSKALLFFVILIISCFSQNVIPIHIAFIPILIPPILKILNELEVDRRLIATILTFGLTAPYIFLPYGFGQIFHGIIQSNIADNGLEVTMAEIPTAMTLPTIGLVVGLLFAIFVTYRRPRSYENREINAEFKQEEISYSNWTIACAVVAIVVTLVVQYYSESMIIAGLAGLMILFLSGSFNRREADQAVTEGMKMMAFIGFVMLTAAGFAAVIRETGHVELLVEQVAAVIGQQRGLAAMLMLVVGLFITMGIGSSFSTIPIIATLFVPLGLAVGFSPMAIIVLIGTAGALGDAGAPASDSTLGPTAGLNADGQHNHIWDTCVPTFLHFNIPLLLFGWIAAMML